MSWLIEFFGGKIVLGLIKASLMTFINGLIIVIKVAIVSSFVAIAIFIFNKFYDLLSSVEDLVHGNSDSTVSWALQVVSSMGIWDAFVDSFMVFSPMIIALIVIFLSKKGLTILNQVHKWGQDVTRINYI